MNPLSVISFEQPAGSFLLTVMRASDVIRISRANPRHFDVDLLQTVGGIQRATSQRRIDEIAEYARTVDATFPTPILLALEPGTYRMLGDGRLELTGEGIADIVDGQHRVRGLEASGKADEFDVPVVFILDATEEQKALIFATINGKQTKVPASLIYDLFGVTETRSPQKSAHEIARALNSVTNSPWFRRLKMLGRKTPGSAESLSQGTFVQQLLPHISSNPVEDQDRVKRGLPLEPRAGCVFNEFWRTEKDPTILKILLNFFDAARTTWPAEWERPQASILTRTVGFQGLMAALPQVVRTGLHSNDLSCEYFRREFLRAKDRLTSAHVGLTSDHFPSSGAGANRLRDFLLGTT
jgi:DGQHR domain-containing protein